MYTLRAPQTNEFEQVADFIFEQQARPERRCLHLDWNLDGIRADLKDLDQPFEEAFRCVFEQEQLVGVLGSDLDHESGRGWLHGPFARQPDWSRIGQLLFDELWQRLPQTIQRLSNYLELANHQGLELHLANHFSQQGVSHIYQAAVRPTQAQLNVRQFIPTDQELVCQLHEQAFAQSWLHAAEMISQIDPRHPLLIACVQEEPVGYLRLSRHVSLSEATVDFVAIKPDFRGQGLGRQLLEAALQWTFGEQKLTLCFLNVSDSNTHAQGLYQSVGFELLQSGATLDWYRA